MGAKSKDATATTTATTGRQPRAPKAPGDSASGKSKGKAPKRRGATAGDKGGK